MLRRGPAGHSGGGVTLLFAATMLLLVAAAAATILQMLLTGRQLAMAQLDREIAFRAAEVALLDAEADFLAAAAGRGAPDRFDRWPPAGQCGSGAQSGICRTSGTDMPVWQAWLLPDSPAEAVGIPLGRFTGATLPDLPDNTTGTRTLPRYVAELLDDAPPGSTIIPGAGDAHHPPRLRITAIGFGRTTATRAVVQSILQP